MHTVIKLIFTNRQTDYFDSSIFIDKNVSLYFKGRQRQREKHYVKHKYFYLTLDIQLKHCSLILERKSNVLKMVDDESGITCYM